MKFKLINDADGNDKIELVSTTETDAYSEALDVLGWTLVGSDKSDYCDGCKKLGTTICANVAKGCFEA